MSRRDETRRSNRECHFFFFLRSSSHGTCKMKLPFPCHRQTGRVAKTIHFTNTINKHQLPSTCDQIINKNQPQHRRKNRHPPSHPDQQKSNYFFCFVARRAVPSSRLVFRGLDVPDLVCVINYSCPNHLEDYVHRVGRTGRAGRKGTAYTFISAEEEKHAPTLIKALTQSKQKVRSLPCSPFPLGCTVVQYSTCITHEEKNGPLGSSAFCLHLPRCERKKPGCGMSRFTLLYFFGGKGGRRTGVLLTVTTPTRP